MSKIFNSIIEWQKFRASAWFIKKNIGLVTTMGNLHAGHASLLKRAREENDITILTIFVNPTQFNNQQDLKNYPRTLQQDIELAQQLKTDFILVPTYAELYHDNYCYRITENNLSLKIEGKHRPGHFDGVLTVVMKLLMLVKPTKAYFGEKDYQQLQLVTNMAKSFFLDLEIVPCSIVRDKNGLALSSRNNFLTLEQKELAAEFQRALSSNLSISAMIKQLEHQGFSVEYIEEHEGRRFGAAKLGEVRLIDNVSVVP